MLYIIGAACVCNGKANSRGQGGFCKEWTGSRVGSWCFVDQNVCPETREVKWSSEHWWSTWPCKGVGDKAITSPPLENGLNGVTNCHQAAQVVF